MIVPVQTLHGPTFKAYLLVLIAVASLSVQAFPVLGTEESREIAFEQEIGREILDLDLELLNAIKVEGFISGPYVRFHLPAQLSLEYVSDDVYPGATVPLTFKFMPYDGSGLEFESKFGIKFGVDITVFEWDFGFGYDFEKNFVPPMTGDTCIPAKSVVDIWAKRVRCVGGYNLSLYGTEEIEGDAIKIDLQIIEPAGGDCVYFETAGQDHVQIVQDTLAGENSVNLVVQATPPYFGKIKIRADITEKFPIKQLGGYLKPGIGAHFVKDWFCNYHSLKHTFDWFEITPKLIKIPIDSTETEPLEWELESKPENIAGKIQDLILETTRLHSGTPPVIGEPDTLVTVIRNVHGTICYPYESIHLEYSIDEGTGLDSIGERVLTPSDASLLNFNNGSANSICDTFIYEPDYTTYILTKSHDWPIGELYPRYVVVMSAETSYIGGCDDWTVVSETPDIDDININLSRPANNIDIVPFDLPLPDFCLDSLGVDSPPYVQCGDYVEFEIGVSNRGVDWPPNMSLSEPEDNVFLVGRAIYMRDSIPMVEDIIEAMLITPMANGSSAQCIFEYEILGEPELSDNLPIHRVRFVFDVNGGNEPGQEIVWEGDFDNNTMDTYQYFATYPDSALPSDSYYLSPQTIQPKLPPVLVGSTCHEELYLYVADDEFSPVGEPGGVSVEIGLGDLETSPRDSSWTWYPCLYAGDFTDSDAKKWKVYVGDTWPFALTEYGLYSYCFRVSYNKYEPNPLKTTHLYVDNDGACSSFEEDNYYYYNMAGIAYHEEDTTGWHYKFEHLFQDNFPESESVLESYVRADMAYDLRSAHDPLIDPGDSIVVFCIVPGCSEIDTTPDGWPTLYMHVKCTYIGDPPGAKPDLYGQSLEGTYGRYFADDGETWTVIQGEVARISGVPIPDRYMFDLNDSLLTRGYQIEYYFKAQYTSGHSSTLPDRAESENVFFEFTCLPTLASDILYVDDYHGLGSFEGRVQNYFDKTFSAILPPENEPPDRYDVNSPDAHIANGLGSRAKVPHLTGAYNTIIWDSGDLRSGTITDGTVYSGKSDDCQVLIDWMESSDHDVGLWICGDDVARDLDELSSAQALALMNMYCGVQLVNASYFEMTGGLYGEGVAIPLATGITGSPFHHVGPPELLDTCFLYGSYLDTCTVCDSSEVIKDFDVLEISGPGAYALGYPEFAGDPYYAGIYNAGSNFGGHAIRTMWFGFSFMHIRDYLYEDVDLDRSRIAADVLSWMGHTTNIDITGTHIPPRYYLTQNYPNPFNPYTTIAFGVQEKGHVTLKIYNVAGQLIRTLVDGERDAGTHKAMWDGKNNRGATCASGVYFYMIKTKNFEQTKKIVLLR